jgi:hypothetical protein
MLAHKFKRHFNMRPYPLSCYHRGLEAIRKVILP